MEHDFISISGAFTRRIPCVVVADCVGDSGRSNVTEIEHALREFHTALQHDISFRDRLDMCVICAGKEIMSFRSGEEFQIPHIAEDTYLSLDNALDFAIDLISSRVEAYRLNGIIFDRPMLYVMSDGRSTNCLLENHTKARLQNLISAHKLVYVPVGIGYADVSALQSYYPTDADTKPVLKPAAFILQDSLFSLEDDVSLVSHDDNFDEIIELLDFPPPTVSFLDLGEDEVEYPVAPTTVTIPLDDPNRVSPCIFLIDRSSNISSKALTRGERMIQDFCNDLESTDHIKDAEICVISYADDVTVDVDFCESSSVKIPSHIPSGGAAFNEALLLALDKLEQRQKEYSSCGKHCRTPYIFAVGTGISTDSELKAVVIERLQQLFDQGNLNFCAVGCGLVDVEQFCSYYGNDPYFKKAVYPTIISALPYFPIVLSSLSGPLEPITITLDL